MTRRPVHQPIGLILILGLLSATVAVSALTSSTEEQLDLLVDVRHELVSSYVEPPDEQAMIEGAVRGMIQSLKDPHTHYFDLEAVEAFEEMVASQYSGIGAEISIKDDRLHIVTPLEDSPAWKAGVLAGDTVLEIENEDTDGLDLQECRNRLLGEPNTQVSIRVRHESGEEEQITITRAIINIDTVRGFRRGSDQAFNYMLDDKNKIGYIRIRQFTEPTADEVLAALELLAEQGAAALILDMRFNPGGLLQAAVEVSDMFLKGNQLIVSVEGRNTPQQNHESTDQTVAPKLPIVVLANEFSASASEIVTGALADNNRALFVGSRTFGKGSVQQIKELETGQGALKLTTAYWYTPSGRMIHKRPDAELWGVDPSEGCYVKMTSEQMKEMLEIRRGAEVIQNDPTEEEPDVVTPQWIEQQLMDHQLAAALRAVIGHLRDGTWPQVGQTASDALFDEAKRDELILRRDRVKDILSEIEAKLKELDEQAKEEQPEGPSTSDEPSQSSPREASSSEIPSEPANDADNLNPLTQPNSKPNETIVP